MKTSELSGAALDWAVTKAVGFDVSIEPGETWRCWGWATDWGQGGTIIESEGMHIDCLRQGQKPVWEAWPYATGTTHIQQGTTPLIAAMRCYVASKLGDEVEIPEALK